MHLVTDKRQLKLFFRKDIDSLIWSGRIQHLKPVKNRYYK